MNYLACLWFDVRIETNGNLMNSWLQIAYVVNLFILVPVCYSMFFGNGMQSVFEGKVDDSQGLRLLVGSLWLAILFGSALGLWWPRFFSPIIILQVIYKSTWLAVFVLPAWYSSSLKVPWGISACFAGIVVVYPILFFLAYRGPNEITG